DGEIAAPGTPGTAGERADIGRGRDPQVVPVLRKLQRGQCAQGTKVLPRARVLLREDAVNERRIKSNLHRRILVLRPRCSHSRGVRSLARYTFDHDRSGHPDPVDHPADDATQYAVSVHGVSDGLPAVAGLSCGADGSVDRPRAAAVVYRRVA